MSEQLQKEIQDINQLILEVGTRVEEAVRNSMDALKNMDFKKAKKIQNDDGIIDRLEVDVEELCLKCFALRLNHETFKLLLQDHSASLIFFSKINFNSSGV